MLASGSTGNCTALVNDENDIVLIDCGIPQKKIKSKLEELGLSFDNIKQVIITHTHTDHVASVRAFDDSIVYINEKCEMSEFNQFGYFEHLNLSGFDFYTLPVSHDSAGTTGFLIRYKDEKMAYITDTGYIHDDLLMLLNNCDIYCFESNHDPRLLMLTNRPLYLKNRILSSTGHLSNEDCAYALGNIIGPKTKEIMLLHRSQEANTEEMIAYTFKETMKKMKVDISNIKVNIASASETILPGLQNKYMEETRWEK